MTIAWQKLGRLYAPEGKHPLLATHAANPLAIPLGGSAFRVFFNGRDDCNRSSIGWVDIDLHRQAVLQSCEAPLFGPGPDSSFFSHGISLGSCYAADGKTYLLFMGWHNPADQHWRGEIGRLVVNPDLTLDLDSGSPLIGISPTDPISLSYPWAIRTPAGYRMWYGSTRAWDAGNGEMLHVINQASSYNGHTWNCQGLAVPYVLGTAQAFSRPAVSVAPNGNHHMWVSCRGGGRDRYRIAYCYSDDGENWEFRDSDGGLQPAETGWDSEMIEYPFVFEHEGQLFMLYNGNHYGATGFGLAILE